MIDRRYIAHLDWVIIGAALILSLMGIATIFSATFAQDAHFYKKQFSWLVIGFFIMIPVVAVNYSHFSRFGYVIFGASILSLILALTIGRTVAGAQRWISLGFLSFQPSEFAKIAFIIALAKHLSSVKVPPKGLDFKELIAPLAILFIPFILIAKQPDLGTALIFCAIFASMTLMMRIRFRVLLAAAFATAILIPLAWGHLKAYQKARVLSFMDPSKDPLGSGYHIIQSKIAVGSGGLIGKGFTQGTQGSLMFLPEHHTDFIFSILSEEWGFAGVLAALILFLTLILRGMDVVKNAKDRFGFLVSFGIISMLFWHVTINLGMVTGLLPVVGVPLPFFSYGGSFLLTVLISMALLININMRRFSL
ncbi:MAG TPA: rod shape-determining protein RodA [Thermodesulfobacteriota bacterium]|nr:rod shape-determining protein RodA [Thermodesulfobacteriota bacterium]